MGNGGFGPGLGLVGAFPTDSEIEDDEERNWKRSEILCPFPVEDVTVIDLEQYEAQHGHIKSLYLSDIWPKDLISVCHWGCGYFSFLHARTGHVYYFAEDSLSYEADSLEQWLERWLQEANAHLSIFDSYLIE